MDGTLAPAIFKPEKNLVFFTRIGISGTRDFILKKKLSSFQA